MLINTKQRIWSVHISRVMFCFYLLSKTSLITFQAAMSSKPESGEWLGKTLKSGTLLRESTHTLPVVLSVPLFNFWPCICVWLHTLLTLPLTSKKQKCASTDFLRCQVAHFVLAPQKCRALSLCGEPGGTWTHNLHSESLTLSVRRLDPNFFFFFFSEHRWITWT